jgi:formate hydrogenlyase transcriptional activator
MPSNEIERLAALSRYQILDTPAELEFDDLAGLAAWICRTPIALITLVDGERQWFKARVGLDAQETPRDLAFCSHAIQQPDLFVVPDALADPRFASNPLVTGEPGIRFYAGTPLLTPDGQALGTLCVIDRAPRELSDQEAAALRALGRQVAALLELRRAGLDLRRTHEENQAAHEALRTSEEFKTRIIESSRDCIKVLDLEGHLLSMNLGGMEMLEICDLAPLVGSSWIDFWEGDDREAARAAIAKARGGGVGRFVGFFPTAQTRRPMWFDVAVSPILGGDAEPDRLLALSRDVTARKQAEENLRDIAKGTAAETGIKFFRSLVHHLAHCLGAEYAFVAECTDQAKTQVRTLAFWKGHECIDNVAFALAGTPCEKVIAGEVCVHRKNLQALFPLDTPLVAMGAESYLGVPLRGGTGEILGHLAVIDTRPMEPTPDDLALLRIFASRAGAELERQRAEDALRKALEKVEELKNRLQAENIYLHEEIRTREGFEDIVGQSTVLQNMLRQVEQVAPTDAAVLITGETGTGKELVARAVHNLSRRKERPLVTINCGAISPGLVESELFGHEKGAFTGAVARKIGRFELADGGTIFLDEIGDLSADLQVKLLRVLQEGEIDRLGGTHPIKVDVRVLAATHRDLDQLVEEGDFRADLFYRLNVFPIHAPALRERREDIPLLVRYLVNKYGQKLGKRIESIPPEVMEPLCAYAWPGNIRELGNVVERSVIITRGTVLELGDWIPIAPPTNSAIREQSETLEAIERNHILAALERVGWKVSGATGAAAALGLKPTTLEFRMKKLGISRPGRAALAPKS